MELNRDIETRDKILFGKYRPSPYEHGGIRYYNGLTVQKLKILIENNFADPEECQNLAPSIGEIYAFMQKYPEYTAHGYAVSIDRHDYRVSIEGVEKGSTFKSIEEFEDYMNVFRFCDEFNPATMRCWFD